MDRGIKVLEALQDRHLILSTAESCTGGLIAAFITDVPGSSAVFDRGFVTYSNAAKVEMLGVSSETLSLHGAVSPETAQEMAAGALSRSRADVSLSVTGIAGPGGGTAHKPVGLVYIGVGQRRGEGISVRVFSEMFSGTRAFIRQTAAETALSHLLSVLEGGKHG